MKNRDLSLERLSDVRPVDEEPLFPGQWTSYDLALFYPGGLPHGLP